MDIKDLRQEIDSIDNQLVELFEKRMRTASAIADYKRANGLPVSDKGREREVINKVTEKISPEFSEYTRVLYQTIFDVSCSYQRSINSKKSALLEKIEKVTAETPKERPNRATVACQGVEGAYSQHACEKIFTYPSIMYFGGFEDVFKAVDSGLCRYGILPVENSAAGSVNQVYDLMSKYNFYITHSTKLCIEHKLLANSGASISSIKEIYSHEQALNQCSAFISSLGVKAHVCKNTAEAAKIVAESGRTDIAAIGSKDCAELYGLRVLSGNVLNTQNNYTRFICISKTPEIYPGAKKTSLMLTVPHKPGSLYNIIARFAALGLNLTKLESRPISGSNFEFMFYFDIDASVYSPEFKELIAELENDCEAFTYLGSYTED
ncbi:MAG: chorismate mutase [Clostridia bacterium]|nr:chorismate mutase [Clostridia bacterium]MBQ7043491.1 chorismate mutase [Clostridia bacterium]